MVNRIFLLFIVFFFFWWYFFEVVCDRLVLIELNYIFMYVLWIGGRFIFVCNE